MSLRTDMLAGRSLLATMINWEMNLIRCLLLLKNRFGQLVKNTQQIESVIGSFIQLYSSINDHLMKNVEQLEETVAEGAHN
ncbi:hypothetical protein OS493_020039 [Desmophyllum pertusum]|uniref:Uncharacterized protein n=1 Tax=Desmophyllum pertusum TaxID=174260 RepID=A0A9X0CEJ7_9CNID|nr:hypothetical protein OS493_020039 [Desmophyllum pertusum]